MQKSHKIPLYQAILWILLSMVVVTGSITSLWFYKKENREKKKVHSKYTVKAIIQRGPVKEALKTVCLAELLDLSLDKPTNLFALNLPQLKNQLLSYPMIKECTLKRVEPNALLVDYAVRVPKAFLTDFLNTGIDEEGYAFPIAPYFTPKRLPCIFLGLKKDNFDLEMLWKSQITSKKLAVAFSVLEALLTYSNYFDIKHVDVSKAFEKSLGKREIILILDNYFKDDSSKTIRHILRLNTKNYFQNLGDYITLREDLIESYLENPSKKVTTIDFRLSEVAYISSEF